MDFDVLLLDIEGTTTSISFVKEVLFPFIRKHLRQYLEENFSKAEFLNDYNALRELSKQEAVHDSSIIELPSKTDVADGETNATIDDVVANVYRWMYLDKKVALKQLQGKMWKSGYESGKLKGHVYDDVTPWLKLVRKQNKRVCIYSSGSIAAQKLLFGHSTEGNLIPLLSNYFDTTIGLKTEEGSYREIATTLGIQPSRILFLTDMEREAYSARAADMQCILVVREGNATLSDAALQDFQTVTSFNAISIL